MAGSTAFIDFKLVGNRGEVQAMLQHLDSAFGVTGLAAFLHGEVHPYLLERAKNRFAGEGDDAVGKWAPLQPATVEIREHQGFSAGPINSRTHELEEYITGQGADVVSALGSAQLTFPGRGKQITPSIKQKMETAQKGRKSPRTVARPVLGMNEKDLGAVMTLLAFHVKGWRGRR